MVFNLQAALKGFSMGDYSGLAQRSVFYKAVSVAPGFPGY